VAKELRVTIVGDSTALQAALARASGATAGFGASISAAGARVAAAGATLTKGVTLPIAAVGGIAAHAAIDFQNAMELIHTQAGVAQGAIAGLSKGVLSLAGPTATAPDDLAAGLYHLTSQGLRGADSLNALKTAAEGAKMGQANLEDVTNALGAVLASKISGVHSYGQAMGELNATVGAGDMRMQDLADAMGTGLPAKAAVAGVSLRDVSAALAVFGDNNIRGAQAGTLLNSTMRLMEGPSNAAAKAMAAIGLNAGDLGNTLRNNGLVAAIELLKSHLDGLSKEDQVLALTRMFGGKQSGGVQILIDQLGRLKSKEDEVQAGGANFAKDWDAYTQTAAYHLSSLGAQMQASGVTIGTILLPVVSELTNKISDVVQRFDGLSASTKKFILIGAGIAAALGPALTVVGKATQLIGALTTTIEFLAANPLVLAIAGIVALGAAVAAAVLWPQKFQDVLEKMGLSAQHAGEVIQFLQTVFQDVKDVISTVVSVAEAIWAKFGDLILDQTRTYWNAIKSEIQGALEVIRGIINIVTGLIHGDWSQVWEGIKQVVDGIWTIIVADVRAYLETLRNVVVAALRLLSSAVSVVWNDIKSAAVSIWNTITSAVSSAVTSLVSKVVALFKALPGKIKAALGDLSSLLVSAGKDVVLGLIQGIESEAGGLFAKAKSLAGGVKSAFKSALSILSPSRVMNVEVGQPIVQGIAQGMQAATPLTTAQAGSTVRQTVQAAVTAVNDAKSSFVSAFADLANQALSAFDQKVQAWVSPAQKLLDKMQAQDQVTAAAQAVTQAQEQLTQAQDALNAANDPAAQQLATLANNATSAQIALENLKASGTASKQAIASAQTAYDQAAAALKAFQLANPNVSSNTDTQQLIQNVTDAQAQVNAALRAQREQQLQVQAQEQEKNYEKRMAVERDQLAKRLVQLQQALQKDPAEWNKTAAKVEAILKQFGVKMVPSGEQWASMFADGIRQGIPKVEAAAKAMADAVDKYMPHSPAKTGPLSYDAADSGRAWAERFAEGFAGAFPDVNGMTADTMMRLAAGGAAGNGAAGGPLVNVEHMEVRDSTDVRLVAAQLAARLGA